MYPHLTNLHNTEENNFFLMAGPCVIEDEAMPFSICERIYDVCSRLKIPFIFKASFRKDNRSRVDSFTGIGDKAGLEILKEIRQRYNIPVVSDVHNESDVALAAQYVDIIQVPAFLCRQTSLLEAVAKTKRVVNIKKGQFLSPDAMRHVVEKLRAFGNDEVILTERGTTFGYQDLVVDFRSIPIMQQNRVPVVVDVTHSLQRPNQSSGVSGGNPEMIETIARAAVAVGADGLFMETHFNPSEAKSDGANMLLLDLLEPLLRKLVALRRVVVEQL